MRHVATVSNQITSKEKQTSQSETSLGESSKMTLSLLDLCSRCGRRTAEKGEDDGKMAAAGSSSEREQMDGERQPRGPDRTDTRKEAKMLRCTLLNASAWSTEKKYMRGYKGNMRYLLWD